MISIIIPTFTNTIGLINILNYLKKNPFEVIVVDNQPSNKKELMIKKIIKNHLVYLPQKKNLGFAKAVNLGSKKGHYDWLLILNDDVLFKITQKSKIKSQKYSFKFKSVLNPIKELFNFAINKNLVAVSPVLIKPNGEIENVGYNILPYGRVVINKDINRLTDEKLDGLTAACLLIRKKIFEEIGGFDERFFAYLEDVDLFLTLKEKGYHFGIHPQVAVIHNQMTTGKTLLWKKNWHDFKNWILIIFKHPKKFHWNLSLLAERLKNFWGILKNLRW